MLKLLPILSILLLNSLQADNTITITANIATHANIQMKSTEINKNSLRKDIFLKNNNNGLTIALSKISYQNALINYVPLSTTPISLSDERHNISTKVGELIIPQRGNRNSLELTISVK